VLLARDIYVSIGTLVPAARCGSPFRLRARLPGKLVTILQITPCSP
jgi:hypothetical protein